MSVPIQVHPISHNEAMAMFEKYLAQIVEITEKALAIPPEFFIRESLMTPVDVFDKMHSLGYKLNLITGEYGK